MLIACKYEEVYPPVLRDFVYITDGAYTKEDVLQMEFLILSAISFDISFPTAFRFLERYVRMIGENSEVYNLSLFLMELALVDVRMLKYSSSLIAAAALIEASKTIIRRVCRGNKDQIDS
jgi:G2/mitotic-specific cyclin-B, other